MGVAGDDFEALALDGDEADGDVAATAAPQPVPDDRLHEPCRAVDGEPDRRPGAGTRRGRAGPGPDLGPRRGGDPRGRVRPRGRDRRGERKQKERSDEDAHHTPNAPLRPARITNLTNRPVLSYIRRLPLPADRKSA